jgi:ethanolamine utilization protein EutA
VPVFAPNLPLDEDGLDPFVIADSIRLALARHGLEDGAQTVALCYRWAGSASYVRLDAFARGVASGLSNVLASGLPLVLVGEGDVGGLIGIHCREELRLTNPIVSIDGVTVNALDYLDIGAILSASGAVPVVVKSLVFPTSQALGRATGRR